MEDKRELFERMPVPKALATLAIPTIISQLITMIYNLADTFFIGMADNPSQTAASSVSFTLVFLMACISNLFGVGGGSLISRLLGEKRDKDAARVASFSFYGSILLALVYSLSVLVFMDPLLLKLGATSTSLGYARDYALWVIVIGGIPTTLGVTMSHLFRSEGYAKQASLGLAMGGVLNIILDPIFMFLILPAGNETKGAAIATMLSNIAVIIYFIVVYLFKRKQSVLSLSPKNMIPEKRYIVKVFAVGFPSALGTFLACLTNIVINNLTSNYGDVAVAAVGIAKKIDMLPMNVGMGLCQGMMPLVAYNFASGDYKRMKSFATCARAVGMGFSALCIVVFEIFAAPVVSIFNGHLETVALGTDFLRILCLAVPLMIFNFQLSFTFQAMGMGKQSLILSSLRQGLVNIPLLFLMHHFFGLYGVVWTQLVSDSITSFISYAIYRRSCKKLFAEQESRELVSKT